MKNCNKSRFILNLIVKDVGQDHHKFTKTTKINLKLLIIQYCNTVTGSNFSN